MNYVRVDPRSDYPRLVACPGGVVRKAFSKADYDRINRENMLILLVTIGVVSACFLGTLAVAVWQLFA